LSDAAEKPILNPYQYFNLLLIEAAQAHEAADALDLDSADDETLMKWMKLLDAERLAKAKLVDFCQNLGPQILKLIEHGAPS
jgi:hypothetical protein